MRNSFTKYWMCCEKALTLIEAVVGTALLGTLLVAILVSGSKLKVQSALANRRIEACRGADELLERWWTDTANIPRHDSGIVPDRPSLRWRTSGTEVVLPKELELEVIALEILAKEATTREPLARVEVILPVQNDESTIRSDIN